MNILFIYQPARFYSAEPVPRWPLNMFHIMAMQKANPRTFEYCLQSALNPALSRIQAGDTLNLLALIDSVPVSLKGAFSSIETASNQDDFIRLARKIIPTKEKVILLYSDAIGQGFGPLENEIVRLGKTPFALNGRKRLFELTPRIRQKITLRRFFERYFISEVLFSAAFPLWALFFALYERLTREAFRHMNEGKTVRAGGEVRPAVTTVSPVDEVKTYWDARPQTYGLENGKPVYAAANGGTVSATLGDKAFFEHVDATFYDWNKPLHDKSNGAVIAFGKIFEYDRYRNRKVLEIGCGMGTMAMNWASRGADFHAVDLASTSVEQTRRRFELYGLRGTILQGDARNLPFEDNTFDYVYSWGVLHHSPDIARSLSEVHRVLKPGGKVGIMLYYRKSFLYRYLVEYMEGFVHFESHFLSPVALASRYGDGAREEGNPYTYPVTREEVLSDIMPQYRSIRMKLFGTDIDGLLMYMCIPYGRFVPRFIRKSLARRFGWSLWITAEK